METDTTAREMRGDVALFLNMCVCIRRGTDAMKALKHNFYCAFSYYVSYFSLVSLCAVLLLVQCYIREGEARRGRWLLCT